MASNLCERGCSEAAVDGHLAPGRDTEALRVLLHLQGGFDRDEPIFDFLRRHGYGRDGRNLTHEYWGRLFDDAPPPVDRLALQPGTLTRIGPRRCRRPQAARRGRTRAPEPAPTRQGTPRARCVRLHRGRPPGIRGPERGSRAAPGLPPQYPPAALELGVQAGADSGPGRRQRSPSGPATTRCICTTPTTASGARSTKAVDRIHGWEVTYVEVPEDENAGALQAPVEPHAAVELSTLELADGGYDSFRKRLTMAFDNLSVEERLLFFFLRLGQPCGGI